MTNAVTKPSFLVSMLRLTNRLKTTSLNRFRFSTSAVAKQIPSLYTLSEDEQMLKESVAKFANDVVRPKVKEMDEKEMMDPSIMRGMFDQGLMGIEVDPEYEGAGCSFMAAILAVEEMAKGYNS